MKRIVRANAEPIDAYLRELWELQGSDLLLTAGAPPLLRVDGNLRPVSGSAPLRPDEIDLMLAGMLTEELAAEFETSKDLDFPSDGRDLHACAPTPSCNASPAPCRSA